MSSECAKSSSEIDSLNPSVQNFQAKNGIDSFNSDLAHRNLKNDALESTFIEIMHKVRSNHYNISENQELLINDRCKLLFEKDYICKIVNNCNYTMNYPIRIIFPVGEKRNPEGPFLDFDETLYSQLVEKAHDIRRRSRFITPAILFDNKFICRSATLQVKLPVLHNRAAENDPPRTVSTDEDALDILSNIASTLFKIDVEIAEYLKIERIVDFMTHCNRICPETVGFVTSEKNFEDLYNRIKVEVMPFTGSNYFTVYHKAGRSLTNIILNWKERDVFRRLNLTEDTKVFFSEIDAGSDHKNWDLITLTQNYMKIILSQLVTDSGGMLIHCASGWDRTPLFISLLRLSLWADGVIHESLDVQEILYLTIAYDWFLFGHKFPLRYKANEEIMHFCFNFLEIIVSDEFSVTRLFHELPAVKKRNRSFPPFIPGRRVSLNKVRDLFLELYDKEIIQKNKP